MSVNAKWQDASQHPLDDVLRHGVRTDADLRLWMRYRDARLPSAREALRSDRASARFQVVRIRTVVSR